MANEKIKRYSFIVVVLAALSVTMQIAANLISARLGYFGPVSWNKTGPMGVFFFPFVYIISDILSDVYGYRVSRWVAWLTVLVQLLFVGLIALVLYSVKPTPWSEESDQAMKVVMGFTTGGLGMWRTMLAGVAGAVLGGWTNDIIFQLLRHHDGIERFIKRKLLSSLGAEVVDTIVFVTAGFAFSLPWSVVFTMYGVQFVLKYGMEVITSPIAKICAKKLRSIEGDDVFEDRNKFNIFGWVKKEYREN